MVSSLDILPTVLAATNTPVPEGASLDGKNLLPYLTDETTSSPHETLYFRFFDGPKRKAIRRGDWKMVAQNGPWELYNLTQDLAETKNLAAAHPEVVAELNAAWNAWNAENEDPRWQGQKPPGGGEKKPGRAARKKAAAKL